MVLAVSDFPIGFDRLKPRVSVNQALPVPSFVICNIIHIDRRLPDDETLGFSLSSLLVNQALPVPSG
jgi:hypothetical protein